MGLGFAAEDVLEGMVAKFGHIVAVEKQRLTLRTSGLRPDPGILVGEAPGLNRGAVRILQTRPNHALVGVCLAPKIFGSMYALRIHGQSDVKFRDVNLQSQLGQTLNVGGDSAGIVVEAGKVQLQSDAIDRNATVLEIPDHGIDRVGFVVEGVPSASL